MSSYEAARETAALFNLHNRSLIEVAGLDARSFLHNLSTNDIKTLQVGDTREAFLTTMKARVLAHVWIANPKPDRFLVDFAAGQSDKILKHLDRHIISEQVDLADRTNDLAFFRVVGPKATALVESIHLAPLRRHRLLALDGCDVAVPAKDRESTQQKLLDAGAILGDDTTYNLVRIEAGLPEYGIDIDEDRLAMEVNRADAISYNKGCYLGQETIVMARDRGQMNRKMMGLKLSTQTPVAPGTKVLRGAEEVGHITSSVYSRRLGAVLALAYLRRGHWDVGAEVVLADGQVAVVSALPFHDVAQP
jgi:folate-binding protein YgfZ